MTGWCRRVVVGLAASWAVLGLGGASAVASPPPDDPPGATTTTFADNVFIPENVNLSDCISGVPRPGCGSEARGGWRQGLVFVALVGGIAFIGWRIIRSARRNRPDPADSDVQDEQDRASR